MLSISNLLTKKALKKANVMVSVITHRKVNIDVMSDCITLFANKKHDFTWAPLTGEADISQGRSRVASMFYTKSKSDILMFIDDDIRFTAEDVNKIVDHVMDGKLICGGMYVQKGTLNKTAVLEEGESVTFSKTSPIRKAVCIPNGFMGISRKVFDALVKVRESNGDLRFPLCNEGAPWAFHPFFDSQKWKMDDGQWRFVPEDWAFCLEARKIGIQTWLDPSIFLGHLGEYEYDLRDRLREPKISWDKFAPMTLQ